MPLENKNYSKLFHLLKFNYVIGNKNKKTVDVNYNNIDRIIILSQCHVYMQCTCMQCRVYMQRHYLKKYYSFIYLINFIIHYIFTIISSIHLLCDFNKFFI